MAAPAGRALFESPSPERRLEFVQHLRIALICLVVAHHAGQAYGPTGGAWPVRDGSIPILGAFFAVNAAFFMGLFFLVSGYFVPGPLARHGAAAYARGRLVRLGIPLVVMMVCVFWPSAWAGYRGPLGPFRFFVWNYFANPNAAVGHMWFVANLLLFTLAYVAWRASRGAAPPWRVAPPGHRALVLYAVVLGVVSAVVRVWYPIDRWVTWIVPSEVAHLPQYVSLFALGIVAAHGRWFETLPRRTGLVWLAIGTGAALVVYLVVATARPVATHAVAGGADPGSFVWSVWEAFLCVGLCTGLVVAFREFLGRPSARLAPLGDDTFGVYVVHVPIVVVLQGLLLRAPVPTAVKFLTATAAAIVLSFALVERLRQSALVRRVL